MNGVDSLVGALGRGIDKITNIVGKWGSSQPVDDSKSGIKIGDKMAVIGILTKKARSILFLVFLLQPNGSGLT